MKKTTSPLVEKLRLLERLVRLQPAAHTLVRECLGQVGALTEPKPLRPEAEASIKAPASLNVARAKWTELLSQDLLKSRIAAGFKKPSKPVWGHPAGCPGLAGECILTDGFENIIRTAQQRIIVVHAEWFNATEESGAPLPFWNPRNDAALVKPNGKAKKAPGERKARVRKGDLAPDAVGVDFSEYLA